MLKTEKKLTFDKTAMKVTPLRILNHMPDNGEENHYGASKFVKNILYYTIQKRHTRMLSTHLTL